MEARRVGTQCSAVGNISVTHTVCQLLQIINTNITIITSAQTAAGCITYIYSIMYSVLLYIHS